MKKIARYKLTDDQWLGHEKIDGSGLYLSSLTSIPEGFNPTVGGDLYLSSLTSIPEGFNPTVGGDLYLSCLLYTSPSPRDQRGSRMPSSA